MTGDSSLLRLLRCHSQWSAAQSLLADEISIDLQIFCSLADPRPHNCLSSQHTSYNTHHMYIQYTWVGSGVLYVMLHNGTCRLSGVSMSALSTMRIYSIKTSALYLNIAKSRVPKNHGSVLLFVPSPVWAPLSVYPCPKWCLLNQEP